MKLVLSSVLSLFTFLLFPPLTFATFPTAPTSSPPSLYSLLHVHLPSLIPSSIPSSYPCYFYISLPALPPFLFPFIPCYMFAFLFHLPLPPISYDPCISLSQFPRSLFLIIPRYPCPPLLLPSFPVFLVTCSPPLTLIPFTSFYFLLPLCLPFPNSSLPLSHCPMLSLPSLPPSFSPLFIVNLVPLFRPPSFSSSLYSLLPEHLSSLATPFPPLFLF